MSSNKAANANKDIYIEHYNITHIVKNIFPESHVAVKVFNENEPTIIIYIDNIYGKPVIEFAVNYLIDKISEPLQKEYLIFVPIFIYVSERGLWLKDGYDDWGRMGLNRFLITRGYDNDLTAV